MLGWGVGVRVCGLSESKRKSTYAKVLNKKLQGLVQADQRVYEHVMIHSPFS